MVSETTTETGIGGDTNVLRWKLEGYAYELWGLGEMARASVQLAAENVQREIEAREWAEAYRESAKIDAIGEERHLIGGFLEWLQENGRTVSRWREAGDNGEPRWIDTWYADEVVDDEEKVRRERGDGGRSGRPPGVPWKELNPSALRFDRNPGYHSWEAGYHPEHATIEKLLAEYYGIDLDAYAREQRAMLEEVRDPAP